MSGKKRRGFVSPIGFALCLALFSMVVVNYWIYSARWWFIKTQSDVYFLPPTISRAIAIDFIGDPFAFWITVSAVCLAVCVGLMVAHYIGMRRHLVRPRRLLWAAVFVIMPLIVLTQAAASVGMHMLSVYRFPDFHTMHMVGSYTFFANQALVIVLYTIFNHAVLRDPDNALRLELAGELSIAWVRRRRALGLFCIAFTLVYFALFQAKNVYPYEEFPWIYIGYVSAEPALISMFLFVLVLSFADKFRLRPVVDV